MPSKKDTTGGESGELLVGFTDKETKLFAAAFLSSTAPDKYDYDAMATLTKNTAGSLKKMWPPVKKKAMENYPSFVKFLGQAGFDAAAPAGGESKPAVASKGKKRRAAEEVPEDAAETVSKGSEPASTAMKSDGNKSDSKKKKKKPVAKKKAPAARGRGRPKKQAKKEEDAIKSEEASQERRGRHQV